MDELDAIVGRILKLYEHVEVDEEAALGTVSSQPEQTDSTQSSPISNRVSSQPVMRDNQIRDDAMGNSTTPPGKTSIKPYSGTVEPADSNQQFKPKPAISGKGFLDDFIHGAKRPRH